MKNKIIYSIIVCFWALAATLSAQSIGLRFPDTTMVQGDTIVLPLYVDSTLTGEEVYSFNLDVRFSNQYFDFVKVSTSDMSSSFGQLIVNASQDDKVLISGASGIPLSGTGPLLYVHLRAVKDYRWGIYVELYSTSFLNEGLPLVNATKGKVSILAGPVITITPNDASLLVGETLNMAVYGDTVGPFVYDVLESGVGSIDEDGLFTALMSGATKVQVRDSNNTVDETNGEINVFDFSLNSPHDMTEWQGGKIDIPVIIHNAGSEDLISGSFKFDYDDRILTFDTLIAEGTLLDGAAVEHVQVADDKLMVNFASGQSLGADSILVYLRFDISRTKTGSTYFDYTDILFNESVTGLNRRGYFRTINYQTVSFYSSKYTLIAGDVWPMTVYGGLLPYTFTSDNEMAAIISDEAQITALRGGTVHFTATDSVGSEKVSNKFTVYDTYVEIADTTGPLLTDYLLPVHIGDLPSGTSVNAFQMTLTFRQPELEFLEVVSANSLTDGWALAHSIDANKLMISGAGTNELTEKGILFYVKFRFTDDFTLNERVSVTIDEVMLNEGSPTALDRDGYITCVKREDLMVTELLSPLSDCVLSAEEEVTIEIRNNGFIDYSKGDTLMVSYTFGWSAEVVDTIILSQTFHMKSNMQYTFGSTLDMLSDDQYYLVVKTKLSPERDGNVSNDKLSQYVANYTDPTLNLGEDISTCTQAPIILTAPEDFAYYEWSTGAVDTNRVSVDTSSTVWLRVMNQWGCVVTDTVEVMIYPIPDTPEIIFHSQQGCVGDTLLLEAPSGYKSYLWTTGQTDSIITVTASGEYGVMVYNEGMCMSDTSDLVDILFYDLPTADFSYSVQGLSVGFTNLSHDATSYQWSFGDGIYSSEENPTHTYMWNERADLKSVGMSNLKLNEDVFGYIVRLKSFNGICETYKWDTIPAELFASDTIYAGICEGEVFAFDGEMLSVSGKYYRTYNEVTGAEIIEALFLTVTPQYNDTMVYDICEFDAFEFNGQLLNVAGFYRDSFVTATGCDSIINLELSLISGRIDSIAVTIPEGTSYTFGNQVLWTSGVYVIDEALEVSPVAVPCVRTVLTLTVEPTGLVEEGVHNTIKVYPNPARDVVKFSSRYDMSRITIYNALGLEVLSQDLHGQEVSVNLTGIAKQGIHFVRIKTRHNGAYYIKMLIE